MGRFTGHHATIGLDAINRLPAYAKPEADDDGGDRDAPLLTIMPALHFYVIKPLRSAHSSEQQQAGGTGVLDWSGFVRSRSSWL